MRIVLQRVLESSVSVSGKIVGSSNRGILLLFGAGEGDTEEDCSWMADKCANLRIFEDDSGKMNLSTKEINGDALVVSQFTLYGDCSKGRRPSFSSAEKPERANQLYVFFVEELKKQISRVETGIFQAMMQVSLVNDGPVTLILEK